jgi:hypothetical protein
LIYICVGALLVAMIVVVLFNLEVIDNPSWLVERLGLDPANPVVIRQVWADGDYYMPCWLALVPRIGLEDQGFGLHFTRQPFIYIEPTDTWYYTAGLFWFAIADTSLPGRRFCLVILGIALAVSFSVAGVLATLAAVAICIGMTIGGRKLVFLLVGAGLLLLAIIPLDTLLKFLGGNKSNEFHYYKENVTVFTDLTLFGHAPSTDEPKSYGVLAVLYRYGEIGAGMMFIVVLALAAATFEILRDRAVLGWRRFPLFMGCFVSLAVLTKFTEIVPVMPTICLTAALSVRQMRMDPFRLGLLR